MDENVKISTVNDTTRRTINNKVVKKKKEPTDLSVIFLFQKRMFLILLSE